MNKMHSIANIALSTVIIYLLVKAIQPLAYTMMFLFENDSQSTKVPIAIGMIVNIITLAALVFVVILNRKKLVNRIVGAESLNEPQSQLNWIPFSYRLVCVTVGVYMLYHFLSTIIHIIYNMKTLQSYSSTYKPSEIFYYNGIRMLILLILTVYLLTGAPHFVRWQTKKTLQLCEKTKPNKIRGE